MVATERLRGYVYNRVLIESERILDPQFNDAVVFLTGAQIEMLRNVTQYLNRLETYVAEYTPGYYLVPTDEDYDSILEIVADMEETLMGNPNTIWGYCDTYADGLWLASTPAGIAYLYGDSVPEGEVWRVFNAAAKTESASCSKILVRAYIGAQYVNLERVDDPESEMLYPFHFDVVLAEGDHVFFEYSDMTLADTLTAYLSGYKMTV